MLDAAPRSEAEAMRVRKVSGWTLLKPLEVATEPSVPGREVLCDLHQRNLRELDEARGVT